MSEKLKPCRKCGQEAEVILTNNNGWAVICRCKNIIGGYKREQWAIEAWNDGN